MKSVKTMMGAVAAAALVWGGCTFNQHPTNQYTISGQVQGLVDSTILVLAPVSHESEKPLAEAVVINGKFTFCDTINEPRAVYLRIKDNYGGIPLMVEQGKIQVEGTVFSHVYNDEVSYDMKKLQEKLEEVTAEKKCNCEDCKCTWRWKTYCSIFKRFKEW